MGVPECVAKRTAVISIPKCGCDNAGGGGNLAGGALLAGLSAFFASQNARDVAEARESTPRPLPLLKHALPKQHA